MTPPGTRSDQTLALARQGYRWAARLRGGREAVPCRLLGRRAVLVGGPAGVRRFYDDRLQRHGAFPAAIRLVLFGPGAVHGLDDEAHHARKAIFVGLLDARAVQGLRAVAAEEWQNALDAWAPGERRTVWPLAVDVIGRAVLSWAGVRCSRSEVGHRSRQLAAVVDGFARPVRPYLRAVADRRALDRWAAGLVRDVREGRSAAPEGSPLAVIARATDPSGRLLSARVAGVEFLNVVRPTVASSWFVAFAALMLAERPDWRARMDDPLMRYAFAQEVRRHFPFVPALVARTRRPQDVLGSPLPAGGLVVLDVYGTNHDPQAWEEPDRFLPERFLDRTVRPDSLVPQGGGALATGHRCPGEDVVLAMIDAACQALAERAWTLPEQDLDWPASPLPTRPRSGVVLVREREPVEVGRG